MASLDQARAAAQKYQGQLLSYPYVQGVYPSDLGGDGVIIVLLTRNLGSGEYLPTYLDGVRVVARVTGMIQPMVADHTMRYRPAIGGISIGHPDTTAGTLGAIVFINDEPFIASNNHILALYGKAKMNDSVIQPGTIDGGEVPNDVIGHLVWQNRLAARNTIDFALARPISPEVVQSKILELDGFEAFPGDAVAGQKVLKSGRSSGLTEGVVTSTEGFCKIGGTNFSFEDCIIVEGEDGVVRPGDSGSAVLQGKTLVGFLFAGPADPPHNYYFACKTTNVAKALAGGVAAYAGSQVWIPLLVGLGIVLPSVLIGTKVRG